MQLAASETRVTSTAKAASNRVAQMLNFRTMVRNLPGLAKAMSGCRSQLLQIITEVSILRTLSSVFIHVLLFRCFVTSGSGKSRNLFALT